MIDTCVLYAMYMYIYTLIIMSIILDLCVAFGIYPSMCNITEADRDTVRKQIEEMREQKDEQVKRAEYQANMHREDHQKQIELLSAAASEAKIEAEKERERRRLAEEDITRPKDMIAALLHDFRR